MEDELLRVLTRESRHGDDPLGDAARQGLDLLPGPGQVHLVGHDGLRPLGETGLVLVQFVMQVLKLDPGLRSGHVQNVEEERASLDVPQERDAEASIEMGSSDDARDVGNYATGKVDTLLGKKASKDAIPLKRSHTNSNNYTIYERFASKPRPATCS